MNPETTRTHIKALFAAWNRPVTADTFMAYHMALSDLGDESVTYGVTAAIRQGGEHPPSAGQVRAFCLRKSSLDLRAAAHEAFNRADHLARRGGREANPRQLGDPLATHAIGAVGGWAAFCGTVDHWQRRNFIEAYIDAAGNPQLEQVARLSHDGKALGALADQREHMAKALSYQRGER